MDEWQGVDSFSAHWTFPFTKLPRAGKTWRMSGTKFGADREGGIRAHAGCDLLFDQKTPILAISDGVVIEVQEFFTGRKKGFRTDALVVEHDTYIVRYGEILPDSAKAKNGSRLKKGMEVFQGDQIAQVGFVGTPQMLHFELYWGDEFGHLSNTANTGAKADYPYVSPQQKNLNFMRRRDLMSAMPYLEWMAVRSGLMKADQVIE